MAYKLKKQITNSFIYTVSSFVSRAIPFLLLPVFTAYLSKEDYGMLGLIASIFSIASIYVGFRPSLFLIVKAPQMERQEVSIYIYNILILSIYSFLVVGVILLFIGHLFFQNIGIYIFIVLALLALSTTLNDILETIFQVERNALFYSIYQVLKTLLSISLVLVLIVGYGLGWQSKYFADFLVVSSFAVFTCLYIKKKGLLTNYYDLKKQVELLTYLLPLTFHVLGLVLMNSVDRIFLIKMMGLESAGLYTVAYTIGMILGMFHEALLKVWSPEFYERIKDADSVMRRKILKFMYFYIVGSFFVYGVFLLIVPYVFKLMVDDKFYAGYSVVPIIALGLTFEAFRKLFIGYHYNLAKNNRIAVLTISAGIINAGLNYIFIPVYGINGAAYATLFSYIIVFALTVVDLNRIENMNWFLKRNF